uniref:protein ENHANCED PSEUDOMONAS SUSCEPTIBILITY 1-like n=1 Tax=Erigeron canadensis TaxID=72917 RepID=UPI001CB89407|nr:protein ENHANCED PSEUDOMONAS SUSCEPTIBILITY 1-like [Erigeron canadensis]
MKSPFVEIISDFFIKPETITKETNKPTYLSPWDYAMMSTNYIQKGLLYTLPKNQDDFNMTTYLDDLKHSLSTTLAHFHPLAARLATHKIESPPSFVVFINPENNPGARFIHGKVNLTTDDILAPNDVPLIVKSFFDHNNAISHDGHEMSLLSVQVTELVDGIFIGCSINHMVADGSSFWHFFNTWSEVFKSKRKNGKFSSFAPISRPPHIKRWVPPRSGPILSLPFTHEDEYIERPNPALLRERIFHLSSDSLSKLKSKVNLECNTTKISTLQSLFAVVWRCITRAWGFPADQKTCCRLPINNRGRLSPPLPQTYFGNSIQGLRYTTTAGELLDHNVGWAAKMLHEGVVNHGDKSIREFVNSWVKRPFVYKMNQLFDPRSIHIGSSPRFDMYGNEFGLGKGLAVLSGYANKFDGKVTLYEGRDGGGSMDLEVCLLPENMEAFESDQEFMSIVNGEIDI